MSEMRQWELPGHYRNAYGRKRLFRIERMLRMAACRASRSFVRFLYGRKADEDESILDL